MSDIKKKFIDILFEDEDEESEVLESKETKIKVEPVSPNNKSTIKASDILYRKSGSSVFVNLDEDVPSKVIDEDKQDNAIYEMSCQISPIFGVIKENKPKNIAVNQDIIDTQTNKPVDSHLDIITSPIYGYGNKEDALRNNYDVKAIDEQDVSEEELHDLFDAKDIEGSLKRIDYDDINEDEKEDISLFKLFGEKE